MNRIYKIGFLALVLTIFCGNSFSFAADFLKDLSISAIDIKAPENLIVDQPIMIYVTVHNNSKFDLAGTVKFFDEKTGQFIGTDQPISALAGKTDDVFINWTSSLSGDHPIAVRVVPWDATGDNPDNNKAVRAVVVDIDTDHDGKGNRLDSDDDNDGVPDKQDVFPLDARESKDTDHDGIGDNADPDDDNDGVPDAQDAFPLDPTESKDSDGDGIGDTKDVFPLDPKETLDSDHDGKGDKSDPQPTNHSPMPSVQLSTPENDTGKPITFNGLKSSDPDDPIAQYDWDFGDGAKATGVLVDHVFAQPGKYLVTLKVTDARGESDEKQAQVTVRRNWVPPAFIGATVLLLLLILGMLIPRSRFYYKKMITKSKHSKTTHLK